MGEGQEGDLWRVRLKQVVADHGGPSVVARLSEMSLQTLKNHLSGRTGRMPVEQLKIIAAACAVPFEWLSGLAEHGVAALPPAGLSEPDVAPFLGQLPEVGIDMPANLGRWVVRSRALDLAGMIPGDVVLFDLGGVPKKNEPVVAQIYDDATGSAETVLRLFLPPYLIVRSSDMAIDQRPIPIDPDGGSVKIMGAFFRLVRNRA